MEIVIILAILVFAGTYWINRKNRQILERDAMDRARTEAYFNDMHRRAQQPNQNRRAKPKRNLLPLTKLQVTRTNVKVKNINIG